MKNFISIVNVNLLITCSKVNSQDSQILLRKISLKEKVYKKLNHATLESAYNSGNKVKTKIGNGTGEKMDVTGVFKLVIHPKSIFSNWYEVDFNPISVNKTPVHFEGSCRANC